MGTFLFDTLCEDLPIKAFTASFEHSLKKNFKKARTINIGKASTVSKKVEKLAAKKKYYVRIRTYTNANGELFYSKWSAKRTVKTK